MPQAYEVHPDDAAGLECPSWGRHANASRQAVICKTCNCTYTHRYWFVDFSSGKGRWTGGVPKACVSCKREQREKARRELPIDPLMIAKVRIHAIENYSTGEGWDYIEESFTDEELWEVIAGSKTVDAAIRRAKSTANLLAEQERNCQY